MMRRLAIAVLLFAGCATDPGTSANAGTLTLSLTGGSATDGAIVLLVSGGPVASVSAPGGYQVAANIDGEGTHVMVLGNLASGTLATISVPDTTRASAYVVTVIQVSDRNSFSLLDPGSYHVSVRP